MASLPIEPQFQNQGLSTATGFVVERGGQRYLITNWHVVAGKRPDTGAALSSTGAVPEALVIMHNQANALGSWIAKNERLYDSNGNPRWREHPTFRRRVDVVAVELEDVQDVDFLQL